MLNLVEPESTGAAGDLFAIIYIAKEKKLYTLNASGMAPTGATLEHYNQLGYQYDPGNWGPGSGMPRCPTIRRSRTSRSACTTMTSGKFGASPVSTASEKVWGRVCPRVEM